MSRLPTVVAVVSGVQTFGYLICAMVLLSSIIAWISIHFSGPLPHVVCFVLGVLSLICAVSTILMLGVDQFKKIVTAVTLICNIVTLIASICLFVPLALMYNGFCENCTEPEQTQACIDACSDECCFIDSSRPLALVMVIFSALVMLAAVVGIVCSALYLRFSDDDSKRR